MTMKTFIHFLAIFALSTTMFAKGSPGPPNAAKVFFKNPKQGDLKFNGAGVMHAAQF